LPIPGCVIRFAPVCTLILGVDVLGPRTVLLAANRDEDPSRPADPPGLLSAEPLVVGGRDRRAGGTWLALRGRHAAVAMLNRRPPGASWDARGGADDPPAGATQAPPSRQAPGRSPSAPGARRGPDRRPLRSRGLLALDVAAAPADGEPTGQALVSRAEALVREAAYAPFSLLVASSGGCWWLTSDGLAPPRTMRVGPGWHALTHEELDDPREPRAAWLSRELSGWAPATRGAAEARLAALLALHAGDAAPGSPAVCLHEGPMRTVSAARLWLAPSEATYHHAEGRPCTATWSDVTPLLAGPPHTP
jgi:uncharacterized protein with NRDE domain